MKAISGVEMLQRMYDSELTFSLSSDCWDGGFTVKVGAQDPYGEKWAVTEQCVEGAEFALSVLLDMVLLHYPDSTFTKEMDGISVIYSANSQPPINHYISCLIDKGLWVKFCDFALVECKLNAPEYAAAVTFPSVMRWLFNSTNGHKMAMDFLDKKEA